jgi:hypothetical protein
MRMRALNLVRRRCPGAQQEPDLRHHVNLYGGSRVSVAWAMYAYAYRSPCCLAVPARGWRVACANVTRAVVEAGYGATDRWRVVHLWTV